MDRRLWRFSQSIADVNRVAWGATSVDIASEGERALLVATYPHIEERSLLGPNPPPDAASRLKLVAKNQTNRILTYKPEFGAGGRARAPPALPAPRPA